MVVAVGAHAVPAGQFALKSCIVDLALLHIVLTNRPALRCLHRAVRNANGLAVYLQLKQHTQRITEQVAVTVNAACAAVPAVTKGNQQLVFTVTQILRYIVCLRCKVLVAGKAAGG